MAVSFSAALGEHPKLLGYQVDKVSVYGSNLINAETPNYRASDFTVDFRRELLELNSTDPRHLSPETDITKVTERPPLQTMLNGNSVDVPVEQTSIAQALSDYSINMAFVRYNLSMLSAAVNGR